MCKGLAIVAWLNDKHEWQVNAQEGVSSHDELPSSMGEPFNHGGMPHIKFELTFPHNIKADVDQDVARRPEMSAKAYPEGSLRLELGRYEPVPEIYAVVADYLAYTGAAAWKFTKAMLQEAYLRSANLESADLESANLRSANLESADLESANLRSANLESANLRSANLRSADLESANLESANLRSANLRSANLESANLRSANLESANLESANLESANLRSANLRSADLESANLESANLESANLRSANLESANLESANLPDTSMLPKSIKFAIGVAKEIVEAVCKEDGPENGEATEVRDVR